MEAYVDTLRLLEQPPKELQLNLKTSNTQNCQKIKLYGSLTAKDLKKPHSSRWVPFTGSQSSSIQHTERNTGRLANGGDKETWPKGRNRTELQKKNETKLR